MTMNVPKDSEHADRALRVKTWREERAISRPTLAKRIGSRANAAQIQYLETTGSYGTMSQDAISRLNAMIESKKLITVVKAAVSGSWLGGLTDKLDWLKAGVNKGYITEAMVIDIVEGWFRK